MIRSILLLFLSALSLLHGAELKVAVLHPLLADVARQVGGDRVEVVDLIGATGDPHHFEPSTESLTQSEGAKLYLVAGMGLEGYLPKLKTIVGKKATIIEVGATLPALEGECDHDHDDGLMRTNWPAANPSIDIALSTNPRPVAEDR